MNDYNTDIIYLHTGKYHDTVEAYSDFSGFPRPHHVFAYFINGSAEFITDNKSVHANSNDIIYIPKGTTYRSKWRGTPDIDWISLFFYTAPNSGIFSERCYDLQKVCTAADTMPEFEYIYANRTDKPLSSVGRFYCLCEQLLGGMTYSAVPVPDERIRLAADYIRRNFTSAISAETLAEVSHMSVPNLYRLFKQQTGTTPVQYKNRLCINAAAAMLSDNPQMSIEQISDACGFASAGYFRRTFRRFTGKTPREYRRLGQFML